MKPIYIAEDVYLRELEIADAPDMFNLINSQRNYLGRWLPFVENTRDENDSRSFIQSVINAPTDRKEHIFAIISEGTFAGIIGFKGTDHDNKKTEIGYWLGEDFQGRGAATALCNKMEGIYGPVIAAHSSVTALPFFLSRGYRIVRENTAVRCGVPLKNYLVAKGESKK